MLVVEDEAHVSDLLCEVLRDDGYEVTSAHDGAEAVAAIRQQRPDVILLDLMMTGIDGWDFLAMYRQLPGPHAPVIVITAAAQAGRDRAESSGADAVVSKPFSVDRLLDLVAMHVLRQREEAEPERGRRRGRAA